MVNNEHAKRNLPGGFWTFTGLRGVATEAVLGTVPVGPNTEFVLASDGAARYWGTLGNSMRDAFTQPLSALLGQVHRAQVRDPLGQKYPRTGASDDMALLRVTLNRPA